MIRDRCLPVLVAAAILVTGCAAPPASSELQGHVLAVDQVAGFWRLSAPDAKRCDLSLSNQIIDGVRPVLAENCGIVEATRAKSWRATADGFEMLDQDGRVSMTFRRTGEDVFAATSGGFTLVRAPLS